MTVLTPIKPPYINYTETDSNPLLDGEGAQIPVFIGKTGNTVNASNIKLKKFKNYASVKSVDGYGEEPLNLEEANPLQYEIKQFFTEANGYALNNDDMGVPRVYSIDVGKNPTTTHIKNALEEIKKIREIEVVAFVGFEPDLSTASNDTEYNKLVKDYVDLMKTINTNIVEDTADGRFKIAYFRLHKDATVDEMAAFSSNPDDTSKSSINEVRNAIVEYDEFGKTIARICTTPYYEEPGYGAYATISLDTVTNRTPDERQTLFDAGVIFNEDDYRLENPVTRICAGTSTAFGKDKDERPNDCLLHARRNADHQMRELLKIVAPQLKRNETTSNLLYVESDCETHLSSEKDKGRLMDYSVTVEESDKNPYDLLVYASITPVNSTYAIDISCYVNSSYTNASDLI